LRFASPNSWESGLTLLQPSDLALGLIEFREFHLDARHRALAFELPIRVSNPECRRRRRADVRRHVPNDSAEHRQMGLPPAVCASPAGYCNKGGPRFREAPFVIAQVGA
jgi:hypothetical protein